MVLKRTQLAHAWRRGELTPLTAEAYVTWLADFVERLAPHQVLHRLTGDSPPENLLAPHWGIHKNEIRQRLDAESIEAVIAGGLHEYLDAIQLELIAIGAELGHDFFGWAPLEAQAQSQA